MLIPPSGATMFDSRGNYSDTVTLADLQALIELVSAAGGGTVFICRAMTLDTAIQMRSQVTVDFQGHPVSLAKHSSLGTTSLARFENTVNARIVNLVMKPYQPASETPCNEGQVAPLLAMGVESGDVVDCQVRRMLARADQIAYVERTSRQHCYDAIQMGGGSSISLRRNNFTDVFFAGMCNGVLLTEGQRSSSNGAECEGNLLFNAAFYLCKAMITFIASARSRASGRGFLHNTFNVVNGQSDWHTTHAGVRGISGLGNHFDNIFIWDFHYAFICCLSQPIPQNPADWAVTPDSSWTYVNAASISGLLNESTTMRVVAPGTPCATFVSDLIGCQCTIEPLCDCSSCPGCEDCNQYTLITDAIGRTSACFSMMCAQPQVVACPAPECG